MKNTTVSACYRWAQEVFGRVEVGNQQSARRLVSMAAVLAARPAGTVTQVFGSSAEREGAYRLLSKEAVGSKHVRQAMCEATARRCASFCKVYVPIDATSLSLIDRKNRRGLGGVGTWKDFGKGLHVVTAMAVDPNGVPIGIADQTWWARTERSPNQRCSRRKLEDKETRFSLQSVTQAVALLREYAPQTVAVAVMDRGFDSWPILQTARTEQSRFVVRAKYNRRLSTEASAAPTYLLDTLQAKRVRGRYEVEVPAREGRAARTARMHVRAARVNIELRVSKRGRESLSLNAVLATEVGGPPGGALHWMLLTTEPIDTFSDLRAVVGAYSLRWRIEEMHRAWKRGACNVETTQLRSREAIIKWATLHCAVATRAFRLTQLARAKPDSPASEEFTPTEIDAVLVLRKRKAARPGEVPSLGELVRMIADLGGYTGKSSGGPPGPTVIARGLERMGIASDVLQCVRRNKSDE